MGSAAAAGARGSALTDEDLKKLAARWIDPQLAERSGLRRVTSIEGAEIVHRKAGSADLAGLVIPNIWPGEQAARAYRLRRDKPDYEQQRDGTLKETRKYLNAPEDLNRLYFPPGTHPQWLSDVGLPLFITEGEFKALALLRLSWHGLGESADQPRWVSCALSGVNNFCGRIGKRLGPDGDRRDVKGVIPDIERIAWEGRKTVVVYDANVRDNENVRKARERLCRVLGERGGAVYTVDLPRREGINGVDDLLHVWGPDPVLAWLQENARLAGRRQRHAALPVATAEEGEPGRPAKLLTDLGNARRFIEEHGENVRYCKAWGKWLIWDETCWKPDTTSEIFELATETVENIWDEAKNKRTDADQKEWFRWARASQSEGKIRAMVSLATSRRQVVVEPHELDSDPWLLNCANGILDLRTGELRPSAREDLCTKQIQVKYDAYAECPLWRKFLKTVTDGNRDLEAYLQQVAGYALTGSTRQQVMFVLYGTGANGKTTFLEILRTLLGDYAQHADFSSFLVTKDAGPRNDLARLVGARLVTAVEVERGKRLSEATIKQITGGDPITCRFLFHEPFEYTPQFKIFLAANHKPRIPGGEHAIWRRVKVIPFTVRIPPDRQDPELLAKLRTELPGILAWAVEGCNRWQAPGFDTPAAVLEAIEEYREEMDPLAGFIEACCVAEAEASTPSAKLYEAYVCYCNETKEEPLKKNWFGMYLAERGFHARRKGKDRDRVWVGIRLRCADEAD